jgi:NADPH:quinone reductase-like Zn-dependent oxidoreductase
MMAILVCAPVGIESLVYKNAPDPTPAIGDVLVQVHACGFTASELYWPLYTDRAGRDRTPIIPAHEFSDVVIGLGYGTAGIAVGDEVFGLIDSYRDGAAADLIAIEAREVVHKPTTIDFVQAAALPQAGLTSWQALFDHGRLSATQTVVVHGSAGAVGSIAVQLAKSINARVMGTRRDKVRLLVLDLGADEFVDLESDGWEDTQDPVDLVFDRIGGDVLARSVAIVKSRGALVSVAAPPPTDRDDIDALFSFGNRTARNCARSPGSPKVDSSDRRSARHTRSPTRVKRSPPSQQAGSRGGSSSNREGWARSRRSQRVRVDELCVPEPSDRQSTRQRPAPAGGAHSPRNEHHEDPHGWKSRSPYRHAGLLDNSSVTGALLQAAPGVRSSSRRPRWIEAWSP